MAFNPLGVNHHCLCQDLYSPLLSVSGESRFNSKSKALVQLKPGQQIITEIGPL